MHMQGYFMNKSSSPRSKGRQNVLKNSLIPLLLDVPGSKNNNFCKERLSKVSPGLKENLLKSVPMHPVLNLMAGTQYIGKDISDIHVSAPNHIPCVQSVTNHQPGKNLNPEHDLTIPDTFVNLACHNIFETVLIIQGRGELATSPNGCPLVFTIQINVNRLKKAFKSQVGLLGQGQQKS
jgi:hypothetical protein